MKFMHLLSAVVCITLSVAAPAIAQTETPATAITMRQASVEDAGHPSIPVVIWAPATGTRLPLILISHGTGAAPLSHVDTARALAEAGFVVVAPMHPGDNFQDATIVGKPAWFVDRSRHVSRVIDYMLAKSEARARLAPRRIGIFGFSAGATTALVAIGGVPDLARIAPHCATTPEFVCRILATRDTETAPQWTHDPRIAAAVIVAPGIGFTFDPVGLAKVRAPVQLWSGTADETVPYTTNTAIVRRLLPTAPDFHSVDNAVHLSFLAPCTAETPPMLCQDKPGFDRAAFHNAFNESVIAFFRQHLRG